MHPTVAENPEACKEATNWVLAYDSFTTVFGKLIACMSNASLAKSDVVLDAWQI